MQPIIIIDSSSVYDCRTHSLIKSCKFDINIILGSFSKTIPKDQWFAKMKTISLLLLTRFPQEIPKIFQILEVQGCKTDIIKEVYSLEEIQIILKQILENNERKQLPQTYSLIQSETTEFQNKFLQNDFQLSTQTQVIPKLSEDLQRNIPLTVGTTIKNLVENLKGFCIKYSWWNQFYKRISQANNQNDAEYVLNEIAPILVQRLNDLKNISQQQNQNHYTNQQNQQNEIQKQQMEQICQRLLQLINYNNFDVEITDINLQESDEQFLEFLSILFQVLKQMMKINANIEMIDNEAIFSFTGFVKRFNNYSQNQLFIQSHLFAIQLLENIRNQTQINQSTFQIVASILKQLMPDDSEQLMRTLTDRIENNKQIRDKRRMAQDMKQQVQEQSINYNTNQNIKQKNNQMKQKKLDDYLKLQIEKHSSKEEYFPQKKVKNNSKTITVDTSDESYQSSFSFKGEEKAQKEQKPIYFPKLGKQYQYPPMMYPFYNPYCWQYPYQQPLQHQNQFNEQQISQIFNMGLEVYNDRILRN